MHDADASGKSVRRVLDDDRLPVENDLSGSRLNDACQNIHQGGLSRSVLTKYRKNFSLVDRERYIIVCSDTGKFLRDMPELYNGFTHLLCIQSRKVIGFSSAIR